MSESNTLAPEPGSGLEPDAKPPEGQQPEAPPPTPEELLEEARKSQSSAERRWARMTARNAALVAEVEKLARLVPKPDPNAAPTREDLERQIDQRAEAKAREKAFNDECNTIAKLGGKAHDDFDDRMSQLWNATGKFSPELVEAAIEAGDAHELLYKLAADLEAAERIAGLSPARMGAALAKMAGTTAAPKPQSRAAPPINPIRGTGGEAEPRPDGSMEDYAKWREKQFKARGRRL